MNFNCLIECALTASGTTVSVLRRGTPQLLLTGTEYARPTTTLHAGLPCRRVETSSGKTKPVNYAHAHVDVDAAFYLPTEWNGVAIALREKDDRLLFEGDTYEIIRINHPSGGTLTGAQMSYQKVLIRRIENV